MNRTAIRWTLLLAVMAVGLMSGTTATTQPAAEVKSIVNVVQDESSTEQAIAAYFTAKGFTAPELLYFDKEQKDLYLRFTIRSVKGAPPIYCDVDTIASNHDKDKSVTERVIQLRAYYVPSDSFKTPEVRAKILNLINTWYLDNNWFPERMYVNKNDNISMETYINIPGPTIPLHLELVKDAYQRMWGGWDTFWPLLDKELGITAAQPTSRPAP